jgi:uncharacterized membrane protein YkoI
MKNTILCALAVTGLLVSSAAPVLAQEKSTEQQRLSYKQLPDSVRKAVQKNKDNIERIQSFNHEGKTVYEIKLDKKGGDQLIYLSENGTRLSDPALRLKRLAGQRELKLGDLPKTVQQTFRKEAGGNARISEINLETVDEKTIYGIEYTRAGQSNEIRINENGSVAQGKRVSKEIGRIGRADENAAGFDRPLAATKKVSFDELPDAAKRTVREQAGSNRIEDVERGTLDGRVVYEVAFKSEGKHNELRVAEDGSVVKRIAGTDIRFPGSLTVNEVPAPVRRAIQTQVGSGEVNDIDKKTVNGKTVYEVGFKKESGGAQHEIQIAEDGTVIGEPAGAGKK